MQAFSIHLSWSISFLFPEGFLNREMIKSTNTFNSPSLLSKLVATKLVYLSGSGSDFLTSVGNQPYKTESLASSYFLFF